MIEERPWGTFSVIRDTTNHKIKELRVKPGHRLSYQRHSCRSEHWFILQGSAAVIIDDVAYVVYKNMSIDIPCGSWHRIENHGNEDCVLIEIQTGQYFGEDDIELAQDDYGR